MKFTEWLKITLIAWALLAFIALVGELVLQYKFRNCYYKTVEIPDHWEMRGYRLQYVWGYSYQKRICNDSR